MEPESEQEWLRHLLPLPHQITLGETVRYSPGSLGVRVREDAGPMEQQAADELRGLLGRFLAPAAERSELEIILGIVDAEGALREPGLQAEAERLRALPHSDQAYVILTRPPEPARRTRERTSSVPPVRLVLAALDGPGVYYGARTLCQLFELAVANATDEGIVLPSIQALDWPDFDERGLWNFPDAADWIPWLSSIKLNYGKMVATRLQPVRRGEPNRAVIEDELMRQAQRRAFRYMPFILHLNFLHDVGLFRAYPELAGKGDGALSGRYPAHKDGNQHRVPCASQPVLVDILAEWMNSIAAQGAREISCWLSERPAQCGCPACLAVGQFVLEARAFVAAWKRARRAWPDLRIRLFLSTTTMERDYRVLAELPPEVKLERACATSMERVTHRPRDLLANPLWDQYAAEGRWVASYDAPISANGKVDTPDFKLPQRSAPRVLDFLRHMHRRRYAGVYGMIAWGALSRRINGFDIAALAEWSWNLEGRDPEEFATAWAVRRGYRHPEQVGRWAALMGPVEFDVYDSAFPEVYAHGLAVELIRNRRRPYLGEGIFRYYLDEEDFARKAAACEQALRIARELDDPDFAHETRVVACYVELAKAVYQVAQHLAADEPDTLEKQAPLVQAVDELEQAGRAHEEAVRAWRTALGPEPWHQRVHDAVEAVRWTVAQIARFVRERYVF